LCAKIPVNAAGSRRDPPISEPRPMTDAAELSRAAYRNGQKAYNLITTFHITDEMKDMSIK